MPGSRRIGAYELDELIGFGGSSTVWVAHRRDSADSSVAIKQFNRFAAVEPLETLSAELDSLRRLNHPHIVKMLDVVVEADVCALVMMLAEGGSLSDLLGERQLSVGELIAVLAPIADALGAAHEVGICHGDVRTPNILLTGDGQPLLADFGLSMTTSAVSKSLLRSAAKDVEMLSSIALAALDETGETTASKDLIEVCLGAADPDREAPTANEFARSLRSVIDPIEVRLPGIVSSRRLHGRVTREFGPRPPAQEIAVPKSGRRVLFASSVVVSLVLAAVFTHQSMSRSQQNESSLEVAFQTPSGASRLCPIELSPPKPESVHRLTIDLAGDGCPSTLTWEQGELELAANSRRRKVQRFELSDSARASDAQLFVGDWNCDGREGLAYFEPTTNTVSYYQVLPVSGSMLPSRRSSLARQGTVTVRRTGDCDRLVRLAT